MAITYRNLNNVVFPVYPIRETDWYEKDGVVFIGNEILDDKNIEENTLGKRRLKTPHKNLYKLQKAIVSIVGIIKQDTIKNYIDTNGNIFTYEKTKFVPLQYKKIENIITKKNHCFLKAQGINSLFSLPRPPADGMNYVGILYFEKDPWLLYEYSEENQKTTRRKI